MRIRIRLLVHPLWDRVAIQVVLEPMRSYVRDTFSGSRGKAVGRRRQTGNPSNSMIVNAFVVGQGPVRRV